MAASWSQQFAARWHLDVPPDLTDWLDQQRWQLAGGGEFHRPLAPLDVLRPPPGIFWSGLLLPDTLPVIGNDYGDWLCLRVSERGTIAEWIAWSHAGGDWIGVGQSFAEALWHDAARYRQQPLQAGHAAWAPRDTDTGPVDAHVAWARDWLTRQRRWPPNSTLDSADPQDRDRLHPGQLADGQLPAVVARDQLLDCLDNPLRRQADFRSALRLGVDWETDFARWLFDSDLIPPSWQSRLQAGFTNADRPWSQNWEAAEQVARRVLGERRDLSWPFVVVGWSCERRGDRAQACRFYYEGLRASAFTDETARLHTSWASGGGGKFVAARLRHLRDCWDDAMAGDEYLQLMTSTATDSATDSDSQADPAADRFVERVSDYWLRQARACEAAREGAADGTAAGGRAYDAYYRAGWDLGVARRENYRPILEGLVRSAHRAGHAARAAIAEWHLNNLRE